MGGLKKEGMLYCRKMKGCSTRKGAFADRAEIGSLLKGILDLNGSCMRRSFT